MTYDSRLQEVTANNLVNASTHGYDLAHGSLRETVLGMVDLMTIQRAYAANVDALKAMGVVPQMDPDLHPLRS